MLALAPALVNNLYYFEMRSPCLAWPGSHTQILPTSNSQVLESKACTTMPVPSSLF